ncbi:N-acetylglucosamine-6-phosphate deacetylase [Devosia sp. PTR5]|uniref:N-acetylglucosamine-6-phosphate deacetylase n=1 Tax=Devosia oryzisoli TaxID=2774138 RepID=A0A927FUX9_9HYPH|nr:N-acetylglucosamine-6-phosphate deacetylase [Devosia oryzisoli]MBD8065124.1 N-acetylglucosamine-6-phosphate deacetylase [Devosia oryzisoli]
MKADDICRFRSARLFDGRTWHEQATLVVSNGRVSGLSSGPVVAPTLDLGDCTILPGLVDLQCNGGGGILLDGDTTDVGLKTIVDTHARLGTLHVLPTLITTTPAATDHVLSLGARATRLGLAGFLGLHLEGPHLSLSRRGAHDSRLIRPMQEADIVRLERARSELDHIVVTLAAETVPPETIARLTRAGIVVSLGHSDATYEQAMAAFRAGASMATHLFNAMSQMGNREPGLVGAVLDAPGVSAGIIADTIHVHRATMRAAVAAKRGPGAIFLVSDSMAQAGTDWTSFLLGDDIIERRQGALRLADGTLAGADLTMFSAVRNWVDIGLGAIEDAVARATSLPLRALGHEDPHRLAEGLPADFIVLTPDMELETVYRSGIAIAEYSS